MNISEVDIIFEDNHLIAINKKAGQIVQGDKTGDIPLSELLKDFLKNKYQKPGNVFCGVIHRLDRPVSGIIVFAKTSKALSRMNELFRERETTKIYWAVVRGCPEENEKILIHYLKKNEKQNKSFVTNSSANDALRCELSYKVLKKGENYSLLEIAPLTGRHHQIRVQLAANGTPIVGDVKYGDKRANEDQSICLHARRLSFIHPVTKEKLTIEATTPEQKYWNIFETNKNKL
jgi:23S rRNA pseudouridine1911/1915/1917 synthase